MPSPQETLHQVFGYEQFRDEQEGIIQHLISGGDALVLMPTGSGKSLCYQIPSMLRSGVGIIVSPLIALMKNQVDRLLQMGVRAAFLNSSLDFQSQRKVEIQMQRSELDLLYVAPERLMTESFLRLLEKTPLALFAIDEAHCVSQWGHDFRPEYLQLTILHERFPKIPRIALTATADLPTRKEIAEKLQLQNAKLFLTSFDRPNIRYHVELKENSRHQLLQWIQGGHEKHSGIVYCLSRKKTEKIAEFLQKKGFKALPYHAGLDSEVRNLNQERFLNEEGMIMVATIAFGMGIDKPDVRFVAHLDLPKSLEAYFQETGRAGRDGLPADAWMTYGLGDVITMKKMISESAADEKRKRVELQKLNSLLGFCETTVCRRQVLLKYFGEERNESCGNCDTCLEPIETWEGTVAAQKAISCVFRSGERFGANHLIDILLGENNRRVEQFRHDRLSTFGIGKEYVFSQWHSVFRQLVAMDLLTADLDGFGSLKITEKARPILKGEKKIFFRKDPEPKKRERIKTRLPKPTLADFDFQEPESQKLWEELRSCRLELARKQGVPPYMIFHDSTLKELVCRRPQTLEEFSHISGVGEFKLKTYGEDFLEVVKKYPAGTAEKIPTVASSNDSASGLSDTASDTLDLIREGKTPEQIAALRQLKLNTIYNHLAEAIQHRQLNVEEILSLPIGEVRHIENTMLSLQENQPGMKPVFEAYQGKYEYGILHCVRAGLLARER